jgi:hypothetical protein
VAPDGRSFMRTSYIAAPASTGDAAFLPSFTCVQSPSRFPSVGR